MVDRPILLVGGSGVVGRWTAKSLRDVHPGVPILIGGRNLDKAEEVAREIGNAEGVKLDLSRDDLGLADRPVGALAVLFRDETLAALRFAQSRGVGHVSISPGIHELGLEVTAHMLKPGAAPVVLGTEWLVGATVIPALNFAEAFGEIHEIAIGALLDDEDEGGPAQLADLERATKSSPPVLVRKDGTYVWLGDDETSTDFRAADGTRMEASAFSPNDVLALAAMTGAPNVRFSLATGTSSTRRAGGPMSTEIVIEIAGSDHAGRSLRTRHAVIHPQGQMPVTGLGVAMVLERLCGLDGGPSVPPGLYFPFQLLRPADYLARLERIGGRIERLEA